MDLKRWFQLVFLGAFLGAVCCPALAEDLAYGGRTKFEIFGMMDEYGMVFAPSDGETIQRFYPFEAAAAARFKELLPDYCREEGILPGFVTEDGPDGFVTFKSPVITRSIWSHYDKGFLGAGDLKKSEFADASHLDLLRYLRGVYFRNNYKHSQVICAANAAWELHHAGEILSKLGCTDVRIYTTETVPNGFILIYSPTPLIRLFLGITHTLSLDDLNKGRENPLTLHEKLGKN